MELVEVSARSPCTPHARTGPQPSEGGITVPALALVSAIFVIGFEELVQWKYGAMGVIGLLMLTVGIKAKNPTLSSVGAVVLAVLLAGPAL